MDLVGETIGDFHILRLLGQGGMGQVYLAEQGSLKRKVALKLLREDLSAKPRLRERFRVESETVAQLSHPNIVQVYTVGEHAGRHYMVLEYVEGKSLRSYLERKGPVEMPVALSLMRQVASGLQHAHEMGFVHRDIKPENILLTRKGEAKVTDFGLACCLTLAETLDLTRTGTTVGTPSYMSPEQIEGKAVDQRSDLYSFGVTCYHMLTGKTPYTGSNAFEVAFKHVQDDPPPLEQVRPDLPPVLCGIVRKLMAKKPADRYQTARELLKDIARVRESLQQPSGNPPALSQMPTLPERPRLPAPELVAEPEPTVPASDRRRSNQAKAPAPRRGVPVLVIGAVLAVVLLGVGIAWLAGLFGGEGQPVAGLPPGKGTEPAKVKEQQAREEELKKMQQRADELNKVVEKYLKAGLPNPDGVDPCIELGVLYLDQEKMSEAEALFKRMTERRPPSAYYYVGRLGLAVIDALKEEYRAAQDKFKELFSPSKLGDQRKKILDTYLAKHPDFAGWVNEARSNTPTVGATPSPNPGGIPKGGFPSWSKFRKK